MDLVAYLICLIFHRRHHILLLTGVIYCSRCDHTRGRGVRVFQAQLQLLPGHA